MTEIIIPLSIVLLMYWLLREMQVWLHRHIFKVGWLVTKNFETTTILYYTVFLPGVFLNQVSIWLAAGAFNVRAERQISYPEKQEIGELKLDFVKVKKASPLILNLIQLIPFIVGLIAIWLIAMHAFDIFTVLDLLSDPEQGLGLSLQYMFTRPDFWLWAYFVFTIANTMLPDTAVFRGMRLFVIIGGLIFVLMVFDGNTGDVSGVVVPPILSISNGLSLLFGVIIAVDAIATLALAAIENSIEVVTGDSATFKNGKMIAMKRADVIAQRKADREKEQRKREREKTKAIAPVSSGPPSVYALELPLPDLPGEAPRRLILESESTPELDIPRHRDPDVIVTDDVSPEKNDEKSTPKPSLSSSPASPPSPFISDRVRAKPSEHASSYANEDDEIDNDDDLDEDGQLTPETPSAKPFVPVSRRSPSPFYNADGDAKAKQDSESFESKRLSPDEQHKSVDKSDEATKQPALGASPIRTVDFRRDEKSNESRPQQAKPLFERKDRYSSIMGKSDPLSDRQQTDDDNETLTKSGSVQDSRSSLPTESPAKPTGLLKNRSERIDPFSPGVTKPVPKPESPSSTRDLDDLRGDIDDDDDDDDDELIYEDLYDDYDDDVSEDEIDERF